MVLLPQALSGASKEKLPELKLNEIESKAAENIRLSINLSRYRCSDADWQLKKLKKRTEKQARSALQAVGYYHSSITSSIQRTQKCWLLDLQVDTGPRTNLSRVLINVNGALAKTEGYKKLMEDLPLREGAPLNHKDYEKTKSKIEILAARYGFFQGKFIEHRLDIDPIKNQAIARLVYDSGQRAQFGAIEMEQTFYEDNFLRQYLTLEPNMAYDSQALIKQQQLLSASGYFSRVEVKADREDDPEKLVIPIRIILEPVKRHAYRFGIGASTDVGMRGSFSYKNRRVNRRGHDFSLKTSISQVRSEFTADYGIPQGQAGKDRMDFQAGYLNEDTDTSELESYKLAILQTRVSASGWIRTAFLEYLYEDFVIADTKRRSKLLMPGIRFQRTVADNTIFPHKGWRLSASTRLASEDLLSETNLLQTTLAAKGIYPFGKGRLLGRLDLGASEVDDFEKLPASLRFFAGGDGSVRGFDYKSLGPKDEDDEIIGGKFLLTGSIEYEHPIRKQWGLAAFADAGNAFNDIDDYELFVGIGLGIRWHSPIGPIRLDLAQDVEQEKSPRLHLSMGLDL